MQDKTISSDGPKKRSRPRRRIDLVQAYKDVFSSPQGSKVLLDLMDQHGMMKTSYRANNSTNDVLFHEGERNVILRILKIMNVNVEDLKERIEEHEKSLGQ